MKGDDEEESYVQEYFVIAIQPNYRRKKGMKHTEELVSIAKLDISSPPV